jgi:hypothetical protein
MAARRPYKPGQFHSEVAREKIRASQIINRLQKHFFGELELSPTQIRTAEILLRKCVPDLKQTDITATSTVRYVVEVPPQLSEAEWVKKYSLQTSDPPPLLTN